MSQPSIHRSLRQLQHSGLWRGRQPQRVAFFKLLVHAIANVYPAVLGPPTRGVPTAHAGAGFAARLSAVELYVWPSEEANAYGPALLPLHPSVPKVALEAPAFHELMALIDVIRVGRARERRLAEQRLAEILDVPP